MAGSPSQSKSGARRSKAASRKGSGASKSSSASGKSKSSKRSPSRSRAREPRPREYAKEAISEWAKAVRHGAAAVTALGGGATGGDDKPRLLDRLNPAKTENGNSNHVGAS